MWSLLTAAIPTSHAPFLSGSCRGHRSPVGLCSPSTVKPPAVQSPRVVEHLGGRRRDDGPPVPSRQLLQVPLTQNALTRSVRHGDAANAKNREHGVRLGFGSSFGSSFGPAFCRLSSSPP